MIRNIQDRIDFLKTEVIFLKEIFKSMPQDGGRYNTAASVLNETIEKLEFKQSFRR